MAIDFKAVNSRSNPSSGIDYKELNSRLPKKAITPIEKAPAPLKQTAPLENAKNLYSGKGFQVFGQTLSVPTPPTTKSQYNPFASLEPMKVNTKISGSTPVTDFNAPSVVDNVFGAIRATSDVATLPITSAVAAFDKNITVKDVVKSTMDMARADIKSGGTASIDEAAQSYLKARGVGKYGGNKPELKDYAVLAAIGFSNIFGDPALGLGELKTAKEFLLWKNVGKVEKALPEGVSFVKGIKKELPISEELKIKIIPKKNSVVYKGYIKRGTNGEILNSPLEINGIADDISKTIGKEVKATTEGTDLVLTSTGKSLPAIKAPVAPIVQTAKPVAAGLNFGGQEMLNQTPQVVEPTQGLNFGSVSDSKIVEAPEVSQIRELATQKGFRDVIISDTPITDNINNQPAPSGVDLINRTIKISQPELAKDIQTLSTNGIELPNGKVTKDLNEYISSLVEFEKQHLNNVTVEDIQNLRSGDERVIKETLIDLDKRAIESYKQEFPYNQLVEHTIIGQSEEPKKIKTSTSNGNDIITLYHATSKESAKEILASGKILSQDEGVWLTPDINKAREFGDNIFEVKLRYGDSKLEDLDGVEMTYGKDINIKPITQAEQVKSSVANEPKSIKQIAEETKIKEPNVRRILGVGAKEGTFTRVDKGVYTISKDGVDTAWVETGDAVESLPRLAKDGFKADMVFLDIPYDTPAVKGGNRGVKYELLSVDNFSKVLDAVKIIAKTDNSPIIHMFSQATSGVKAMEKYNALFLTKGFKPVGKGEYQKTFADGSPVTSPNGKVSKPEGILVFTKSGKLNKDLQNLNFKLVRPKGYQTEKPAAMLKAMIEMTTEEGETVLDPFAGSGVTGAEALKSGRKAYLIERNADVVENITKPRISSSIVLSKDESPLAKFEAKTIEELNTAAPGSRVVTGTGADKSITGIKSTFPDWIPDQYRKSAIVKPVAEHIINGTMPETKAQLDFYNVVKDKFDNFGKEEASGKEIDVSKIKFEKMPKDKGSYADIKPKGESNLRVMETPEQYRLAKAIGPNMQFIMKTSSRFNGYFKPVKGQEQIAMNRKLYKRNKDESKEAYQLRIGKTMAHEIGHFIDYLPEGDLKRGNLIGRLQSLSNFKQNFIAEPEILKKRQTIMRKINEINNNDELLDSMQAKLTEPLYKELEAVNREITFNNPVFKDELVKLTHAWKPWEEGYDVGYDTYRKSAAELYADFNSVLFNEPALAQEMAPSFYREFFNALGKKPEVEKAFLGIQAELMGDRTSLMAKRYEMLKESGRNAQGRFAAMVAERELARKSDWKRVALTQMWYRHASVIKGSDTRKFLMERMDKGTENFIAIFGNQKIQPIIDRMAKDEISYEDMDAVLKLERIAKDITRENVANTQGLDVKTAGDVLDELSNILGEEKAKNVLEAAKDLRLALKELQLLYPDLFTPEQLSLIASNDFYAVFNVLFNESKNIYHSIKQSTGNIDKDFNTFQNSLVRAQSVIKFGEKNKIKKEMIDGLLSTKGEEIKKANVTYTKMANGRLDRKVKKAPEGWDIVDIKRSGKLESYYLPQDMADSLNTTTVGEAWVISKMLRKFNKPFKFAYTGIINPSFQFVNFVFRDYPKAGFIFDAIWKRANTGQGNAGIANFIANNTYRILISRLTQVNYYRKALPLLMDKNLYGKFSEKTINAMKDGIIKIDPKGYFNGLKESELKESDQAGIRLILQSSGVFEKGGKKDNFIQKGMKFAQSLEETAKLAAYMYFEDLGIKNEKNLSIIRNNVGSPNFDSIGSKNGDTSAFAFFYNPMIQGYNNLKNEAFIKDSAGKSSRQTFWTRKIRGAVIPALVLLAAEEGMFGDDIKKQVRKIPEYFKSGYIVLPMGVKENGSVRFLKMPLPEDTRIIYSLTRLIGKLILHSGDAEERKNFLQDVAKFTGGQIPSQSPLFTIGGAWAVGIFGNGNPYDSFRGQNIFYDNEMKDLPKIEKAKILAKWTFNQNGIVKVALRDSVDNKTIWDKVIISTPILSRVYGETQAGEYEQDKKIVNAEREKAMIVSMKKNKVVNDIVEKLHKNPEYNASADLLKLAKDRLGPEASDSGALLKEFKTLNSAMQEEYITNFGNIHYRSLINQSNDVKETLLIDIYDRKSMNDKEYLRFLLTTKSLNIISTDVLARVAAQTGILNK